MTEGAHLLIVDDERAIAAMLDQYFSMEGYKTTVASDGRDALSAVDAAARGALSPIDLVLLDVNMPDMDGFATCKLIRERLACPIIFLTARHFWLHIKTQAERSILIVRLTSLRDERSGCRALCAGSGGSADP